MEQRVQVIASLEGMRVRREGQTCFLDEFNFVRNDWNNLEEAVFPLDPLTATTWTRGWNAVDKRDATTMLLGKH